MWSGKFLLVFEDSAATGLWSLVQALNSMDLPYRCSYFSMSGKIPTWLNSRDNDSSFDHCLCHSFVLRAITPHTLFSLTLSNNWNNGKSSSTVSGPSHSSCQWVLHCSIGSVYQWLNWHSEFIGKLEKFPQSLIVKCSDDVNGCLERKLHKSIRDEQYLKLTQNR